METTIYQCLNCKQPETAVPLVALRYNGQATWICSQCMPILIHKPEQLLAKLAHAETMKTASQA